MQLSSNVIKSTNVINQGNKEVITLCFNKRNQEMNKPDLILKEALDTRMEESLREAEKIVKNSKLESERAYKEACEKGYIEGFKKGREDAGIEADKMNKIAADKIESLYSSAVFEYNQYLKEKENDIKKIIAKIGKKILKRELEFSDALNGIIIDALKQEQSSKVIVRCNEKYCNSLRNEVENWKRETGNNLDVFIIDDITINENSAVLVKDDGRAILDINKTMDSIEKIILGEI